MAGESTRMLWGLVFLLGLAATHFLVMNGSLSASWAMLGWLVLLLVSNWSIGKSYGKKWPANADAAWKGGTVLFLVLSVLLWLGWLPGGAGVMFALFFLYTGMGMIVTGWDVKNSMWIGMGFLMFIYALIVPTWFSSTFYLFSAIVLGLPMLFEAMMKK